MECYREAKGLSGREVSQLFARYGLYDYVTRYFESLHTTGVKYIVEDIDEYIANHAA
jgi:hypothetical protein